MDLTPGALEMQWKPAQVPALRGLCTLHPGSCEAPRPAGLESMGSSGMRLPVLLLRTTHISSETRSPPVCPKPGIPGPQVLGVQLSWESRGTGRP